MWGGRAQEKIDIFFLGMLVPLNFCLVQVIKNLISTVVRSDQATVSKLYYIMSNFREVMLLSFKVFNLQKLMWDSTKTWWDDDDHGATTKSKGEWGKTRKYS